MTFDITLFPTIHTTCSAPLAAHWVRTAQKALREGEAVKLPRLVWVEQKSLPDSQHELAKELWKEATKEIKNMLKVLAATGTSAWAWASDDDYLRLVNEALGATQFPWDWQEQDWYQKCFPEATSPAWSSMKGLKYDAMHRMNGKEFDYAVYLDENDLQELRKNSPLQGNDLNDWVEISTRMMGLNVSDLPGRTILDKVVPSFLNKVARRIGDFRWEAFQKPLSLDGDILGLG